MRVGYLVPEFPSQTHAFFWREVRALRLEGCEVQLLSTREPSRSACVHAFADEARSQTKYLFPPTVSAVARVLSPIQPSKAKRYLAEMPHAGIRNKVKNRALFAAAASLRQICRARRIDHVHVHSCANAAHVAALSRALGGPPFSLTLHGDLDVYGDAHAQKFREAQFVSVVTEALQRQVVEKLGLPPEFLPVIRMGVDTDRFAPSEAQPKTRGRIRAVTVARLNRAKGHAFALTAIAELRDKGIDVDYHIAGSGPEQANLEDRIRTLKLEDRVRLLGSLSEDAVLGLLKDSDVFMLTSFGLGEAAPVSVMEAMACGLSVVSTRIGGTTEMITDGRDGLLISQESSAEIAAALGRLVSDEDLRVRLGAAARDTALQRFDYRKSAALFYDRIKTPVG